ncbi:MAG TPA: hypothetical protein VMM12_19095 [Longimicrobiales bacterium]|nr:hypothetical protein [Longimicrobiales bacterium]
MTGRPILRLEPSGRGRRFQLFAAVAALLLAAAGCADPIEPADFAGAYELDAVAGEPLPAVLIEHETFRFHVHSDHLILNADGTGSRVTTGAADQMDGMPAKDVSWETDLVFHVVDQRIEIEFVCPPDALMLCIAPPHLIALGTADGVRVVETATGERVPLSYVRAFTTLR